ncbi:MAG: hypothetical protein RIQ93_3335, partial [Verrucomicrobiota bacterium]
MKSSFIRLPENLSPNRAPFCARRGAGILGVGLLFAGPALAADDDINWLVHYDGKSAPQTQGWQLVGAGATVSGSDGTLRILDDSTTAMGAFRAGWRADPAAEVVVEARVRA